MLITRLKEARRRAGLTQEKLGILAGLDEASASTRINQYEKGKHSPNFETVSNLAKVLNVPVSFCIRLKMIWLSLYSCLIH